MPAPLTRPIICLVTDRRRLPEPSEDALVALVADASRAGVTLVQVREHDLPDARLLRLCRRVVEAARPAAVVVNDRTDVALAAGADGVHLRGDSVPAARLRSMTPPGFLIGRSVHSLDEAQREAAAVDYFVMGTIYPTPSKPPGAPVAGVEALGRICRAVPLPVLAIGGVSTDNVANVAAAGAAGIAAIGLFSSVPARGTGPTSLDDIVARVRRAFDR
jgi:thiamine-phosphate pyrophosphorylase